MWVSCLPHLAYCSWHVRAAAPVLQCSWRKGTAAAVTLLVQAQHCRVAHESAAGLSVAMHVGCAAMHPPAMCSVASTQRGTELTQEVGYLSGRGHRYSSSPQSIPYPFLVLCGCWFQFRACWQFVRAAPFHLHVVSWWRFCCTDFICLIEL